VIGTSCYFNLILHHRYSNVGDRDYVPISSCIGKFWARPTAIPIANEILVSPNLVSVRIVTSCNPDESWISTPVPDICELLMLLHLRRLQSSYNISHANHLQHLTKLLVNHNVKSVIRWCQIRKVRTAARYNWIAFMAGPGAVDWWAIRRVFLKPLMWAVWRICRRETKLKTNDLLNARDTQKTLCAYFNVKCSVSVDPFEVLFDRERFLRLRNPEAFFVFSRALKKYW